MTAHLLYCPACAGKLEIRSVGHPSSPHPACVACDFVLWQNPKPSVEALIIRNPGPDAEILLGQRGIEPAEIRWDVPGGFLNLGDEPEPALVRECRREFGISIRVQELIAAFTDTFEGGMIALYYRCEIESGEPRAADIVDGVSWFPVASPPEMLNESHRSHPTSAPIGTPSTWLRPQRPAIARTSQTARRLDPP